MTSRRHLLLFAIPLAAAALYGCPGDDTEAPGHDLSGYEDVLYEGAATDEALMALASALEQGPLQPSTSQAPVLDDLGAGPLPKAPPHAFTWSLGATAARTSASREALAAWTPLGADRRATAETPWTAQLAALFGPPRAARAHGAPFSGTATFLTFSTADAPKLVRVFTGASAFTPSAEVWAKIVAAKAPVTLTLIGAAYDQNRIAAGGGPYQGSQTTFTVAP